MAGVLRGARSVVGALVLVAAAIVVLAFLLGLLRGEASAGGAIAAVIAAAVVVVVLRWMPGEGLLAGLDTTDFSPSLEIEPDRCCVVLRPHTQRKPSQSQPARSARSRSKGTS